MSSHISKATHCYVARNEECGCVIGVVTDLRDKNTGLSVGEFIADGLIVERVDWKTYQQRIVNESTFLSCPHGQMKMVFDPAGEVDKDEKQA